MYDNGKLPHSGDFIPPQNFVPTINRPNQPLNPDSFKNNSFGPEAQFSNPYRNNSSQDNSNAGMNRSPHEINQEAYTEKFLLSRYFRSTYSKYRVLAFFLLLFVFLLCLYFFVIGYNYNNELERETMRGNVMMIIGGLGIVHTILLAVELLQTEQTQTESETMNLAKYP
jgi:hypothetical protein